MSKESRKSDEVFTVEESGRGEVGFTGSDSERSGRDKFCVYRRIIL